MAQRSLRDYGLGRTLAQGDLPRIGRIDQANLAILRERRNEGGCVRVTKPPLAVDLFCGRGGWAPWPAGRRLRRGRRGINCKNPMQGGPTPTATGGS